jgi:DNA-binding transcriptional MerR regulator
MAIIAFALKSEWSLSEAARLLRQPQHRLIYLCEKGVILPDLGDAKGRGSSRRFSARNFLEFAIALSLRELTVPVASVAAIIYALRAFEKKVAREIPTFSLPFGLRTSRAPDLRALLTDAGRLYFSLGVEGGKPKIYGGIDFSVLTSSTQTRRRSKSKRQGKPARDLVAVRAEPKDEAKARIEVSVTRIAKELNFEE